MFENGFYAPGGLFAELAFVEVSSDGVDFARFPATSLRATPVAGGDVIDPTDYHNLAGKHPIDRGTGFDLAELAAHPLVIGQGRSTSTTSPTCGSSTWSATARRSTRRAAPVYDPYPTPFASGGFDADAVGVPEPGSRAGMLAAGALASVRSSRRRRPCARAR